MCRFVLCGQWNPMLPSRLFHHLHRFVRWWQFLHWHLSLLFHPLLQKYRFDLSFQIVRSHRLNLFLPCRRLFRFCPVLPVSPEFRLSRGSGSSCSSDSHLFVLMLPCVL